MHFRRLGTSPKQTDKRNLSTDLQYRLLPKTCQLACISVPGTVDVLVGDLGRRFAVELVIDIHGALR